MWLRLNRLGKGSCSRLTHQTVMTRDCKRFVSWCRRARGVNCCWRSSSVCSGPHSISSPDPYMKSVLLFSPKGNGHCQPNNKLVNVLAM